MDKEYPDHIYDKVRQEVATTYVKHEFRKLLWRVPESHWEAIDRDISDWINSPELAIPRDFWNGFHGICMGFKLKIELIYFITAKNVTWSKRTIPLSKLWFGVEFDQTRVVGEDKQFVEAVSQFYNDPQNQKLKADWLKLVVEKSGGTAPRDKHPIIVVQRERDNQMIYSVYDGNRRVAKAMLEGKDSIEAFVGDFAEGTSPKDYWIPTTILMENLLFAKQAYDRGDTALFGKYVAVLQDMLNQSESARHELKERALTSQQPFRGEVLKTLRFQDDSQN